MTEQSEREKVIKELTNKLARGNIVVLIDEVADWILADRKRIVEPLIEVRDYEATTGRYSEDSLWEAIDQTLKLAGVE